MSIESYIRAMPKVELHVHLEGAIQPSIVLELARRNHIDLPFHDEMTLRKSFTYRDFDHFIETFIMVTRCLKAAEDYELIVYESGAEMARQNVRYAHAMRNEVVGELFALPPGEKLPKLEFAGLSGSSHRGRRSKTSSR